MSSIKVVSIDVLLDSRADAEADRWLNASQQFESMTPEEQKQEYKRTFFEVSFQEGVVIQKRQHIASLMKQLTKVKQVLPQVQELQQKLRSERALVDNFRVTLRNEMNRNERLRHSLQRAEMQNDTLTDAVTQANRENLLLKQELQSVKDAKKCGS